VAYKALLQPELALLFGKRAIEIVQEIRKSLHELDDITQRAFLRRVESVYAEVAAYCFAQNRFFTAEAILLLQRQRELNDLTLRNEQSPETRLLSNDELGTHKNLGSLTQENLQSIIELRRLESFPEGGRSESQRQSLKELTEKVGSFKQSSQKLLQLLIRASLRDSRAQGRGETEAVSTLTILSGGGFKRLALLVNEASPATAGITFVSTDHNLTTMVTLQGGTNTALLPTLNLTSDLSFATLREEIVKARVHCQSNKGKPEEHLKKLYQYLIEPINKFLLGLGVKHLIIQATGILKNIPFAALWDGESFLVERFQIAQYTGHESPEISILSPATDRAAAFAVSLATNGFPELRAAEGEARSIIRTAQNTSGVFEGILNLNEKFTESALNKALQERYAIVHIASHFKFLRQDPANSFLIVGSGSNITLNQLATKRMNAVKLAVLSACQTGVNPTDDLERGHIEGLGTALQQAGAKNVVATLWAILDTSSADLMFNFYQALDQLNFKSVASALRQAQLQMITTKTKSTNVHNKPDLSHPFHWAGFVLMGNSVG
jgi:CHAT domain-containing protein